MPEDNVILDDSRDPKAAAWMRRVVTANKYYKNWSDKFQCDTLEEYYYGFQSRNVRIPGGYEPYIINFIFANLEIKKPTLLFSDVAFRIKPKPASAEFNFMESATRARNREDALNTVISDEDAEFSEEFEAFVCDAFFRFGIMEIGYSANWIENPNAGKPILKSDNNPYFDPDSEDRSNVLREPEELPEQEMVYFKRIPPWRFRVGGTDGRTFKKCSWVGYYDYFRIEDIKANKALKNLDLLEYSGTRSEDFSDDDADLLSSDDEKNKRGDLLKVWVIFDIRDKKKLIIAASQNVTIFEKKFDKLPLVSLKFINKVRGWYPIPFVFNWKSPQDEINDAREQMRIHRRRGARRYLYKDGTFETEEEISKLETGPDMTFVKTQTDPMTSVFPLPNAPLDSVVGQSMVITANDLNTIAGSSNPERGQSDRSTATQTQLIDQRMQMRDTSSRILVAKVLKRIGRLALLTIQKHFTSDFWVKVRTSEQNQDFMQEFREATDEWKSLTAGDLGNDEDFQVDISLDTISPIENQASKAAYVDFLSMLNNFPQIAFDPILVRETAYRCNYRNERVISRMAQMAQVAMLGQLAAAKQSLAQNGMAPQSNAAQTRVAQMQPPDQNQIAAQIGGQLG